ncbi:MAG: hypothetical protein M3340_08640 [Actinomycetota bacterium]|nr:hypothetical protein [Actinomycetota bacterium]
MTLALREPRLEFYPSLAKKIGLNEAIILCWLDRRGGLASLTVAELERELPFWHGKTISRAIANLREAALIAVRQEHGLDRCNTYTIEDAAVMRLVESLEPRS